ncbi:MAG: OmpA family protein [Lautropia sp.]
MAAVGLAGCADMSDTQRGTGIGAVAGTLGGAAIGSATGSGKSARTGAVIGGIAGAIGGYVWSQRMEQQKRALQQQTQGTGIEVTQTPDNQLKLEIPSDISFDVGKAAIKPDFQPVLDRFGQTLTQHPDTRIRIIGHTDDTGTDRINDPLSVNRAASARDYLVARGVSIARIAIDGRGEREPIADNATAQGRAKNRRVEIFVGEPDQAAAPAPAPMPAQQQPAPVPARSQVPPAQNPQYGQPLR